MLLKSKPRTEDWKHLTWNLPLRMLPMSRKRKSVLSTLLKLSTWLESHRKTFQLTCKSSKLSICKELLPTTSPTTSFQSNSSLSIFPELFRLPLQLFLLLLELSKPLPEWVLPVPLVNPLPLAHLLPPIRSASQLLHPQVPQLLTMARMRLL